MSDDLTAAVKATGNAKAAEAVTRANNFYREGMQKVEDLERVINRNGGPEAVYKAMFANAREGGTTLRLVMDSLDGAQQKDLAAATLRRLGRANPSARGDGEELAEIFSPAQVAAMFPRADGSPMSERTLRSEARRHGCCAVVGKNMFLTRTDIEKLVEAWRASSSISATRRGGHPEPSTENASAKARATLTRNGHSNGRRSASGN
jgi:hypothetical protein